MKLWISAGELSGDIQGAELLRALRRESEARGLRLDAAGMGGVNLERAGQRNMLRIEELSVMGVVEVLSSLPRIPGMLKRVRHALAKERPDAVLLVDAPEFNFRVAKIARELNIPVYYFIPPKVWAWRTGRVAFLKKHVRRIFSILPFELDFYRSHGMAVEYVGNPLVDLVDYENIRHILPEPGRIGLMPGSRKKEVESLLPAFSSAADLLLREFPRLSFHCIRAPHFAETYLRKFWNGAAPLHMAEPEGRYAFMRSCQCLMSASGTATLESGLAGVPTLVAYRLNPLSYALGRRVIKVSWISLTNLILGREAFPEHIQQDASPEALAARIGTWLREPEHFARMAEDMKELREKCGTPGSAQRAARALMNALEEQGSLEMF